MLRLLSAIIIASFASKATAETEWLSSQDFEARVEGRATKIFTPDGTLFGIEYFLPLRRTIWQPASNNRCFNGSWVPRDELICFQYQGGFGSCLRYFAKGDGIVSTDWVAGIRTGNTFDLVIVDQAPPTCSIN